MNKPTITRTIGESWISVEPIRIGCVPAGLGTPDCYVLCEAEGAERIRVDLYAGGNESYTFTEARIWNKALLIGWGNHLYSIDLQSRHVSQADLGCYFGHLYVSERIALVASAEHLWRINSHGEAEWKSAPLGLDGVIVNRIEHGLIEGEGEWTPPGGWKPFRLCLDSGQSEK